MLNYRSNGQTTTWKTYEDSDEGKLGLSRHNSWQMTMRMMVIIRIRIHVC